MIPSRVQSNLIENSGSIASFIHRMIVLGSRDFHMLSAQGHCQRSRARDTPGRRRSASDSPRYGAPAIHSAPRLGQALSDWDNAALFSP